MKLIILSIFMIAAVHAAPLALEETPMMTMPEGEAPKLPLTEEEKPTMPMVEEEKPNVDVVEETIIEEIETSEPKQTVTVVHPPKIHIEETSLEPMKVEEKPKVEIVEETIIEEIETSEPKQTVTVVESKLEEYQMNLDQYLLNNQFGVPC